MDTNRLHRLLEQRFHVPPIKINVFASIRPVGRPPCPGDHPGHVTPFHRHSATILCVKHRPDLEKTYVPLANRPVPFRRAYQPRNQVRSQICFLRRKRVENGLRFFPLCRAEGQSSGFVETEGGEDPAHARLGNLRHITRNAAGTERPHLRGERIISPQPCDFFDQIFLAGNVRPPTGYVHRQASVLRSRRKPQAREVSLDVFLGNLDAEQMGHSLGPEKDRWCLYRLGIEIDRRAGFGSSGHRDDQPDGTLDGVGHPLQIGAAFEAVRCFGAHLHCLAGRPDPLGVEIRALEHHVRGLL